MFIEIWVSKQFVYIFVYFCDISQESYLISHRIWILMAWMDANECWEQNLFVYLGNIYLFTTLFISETYYHNTISPPPFLNWFQFWLFCWLELSTRDNTYLFVYKFVYICGPDYRKYYPGMTYCVIDAIFSDCISATPWWISSTLHRMEGHIHIILCGANLWIE